MGGQGKIRVYRSAEDEKGRLGSNHGPKWVYIPIVDLKDYAERVGHPFPDVPELLGPSMEDDASSA